MTKSSRAMCLWTRAVRMEQSSTAIAFYRSTCSHSWLFKVNVDTEAKCKYFFPQPKAICEPHVLMHGDEVKMGETVLSFHIHSGTDTCDGCEPGQVMAHISKYKQEEQMGEEPPGEKETKSEKEDL